MMWRNSHGERERERGRIEHVMGQVRGEKGCDRGTERRRDSAIKLLMVRVHIYTYFILYIYRGREEEDNHTWGKREGVTEVRRKKA